MGVSIDQWRMAIGSFTAVSSSKSSEVSYLISPKKNHSSGRTSVIMLLIYLLMSQLAAPVILLHYSHSSKVLASSPVLSQLNSNLSPSTLVVPAVSSLASSNST